MASLSFVDYRPLNKLIKNDAYALPHIDDTLDTLDITHPTVYSLIYLISGFYQIPMAESSKNMTVFIPHDGLFEFQVILIGLKTKSHGFSKINGCSAQTVK